MMQSDTPVVLIASIWGDPGSWHKARYVIEFVLTRHTRKALRISSEPKRVLTNRELDIGELRSFSTTLAIAEFMYKLLKEKTGEGRLGILTLLPDTLALNDIIIVESGEHGRERQYLVDEKKLEALAESLKSQGRKALVRYASRYGARIIEDKWLRGIEEATPQRKLLELLKEMLMRNQDAAEFSDCCSTVLDGIEIYIGFSFYPAIATSCAKMRSANKNVLFSVLVNAAPEATLLATKSFLLEDMLMGVYASALLWFTQILEEAENQAPVKLVIADTSHGLNYATLLFRKSIELYANSIGLARALRSKDETLEVKIMNSDPYPRGQRIEEPSLKVHHIAAWCVTPNGMITQMIDTMLLERLSMLRETLGEDKAPEIILPYTASLAAIRMPLLAPLLARASIEAFREALRRGRDRIGETLERLLDRISAGESSADWQVDKIGEILHKLIKNSIDAKLEKREESKPDAPLGYRIKYIVQAPSELKGARIWPGATLIMLVYMLVAAMALEKRINIIKVLRARIEEDESLHIEFCIKRRKINYSELIRVLPPMAAAIVHQEIERAEFLGHIEALKGEGDVNVEKARHMFAHGGLARGIADEVGVQIRLRISKQKLYQLYEYLCPSA